METSKSQTNETEDLSKGKGWQNSGLMSYSDKEKQTVFKFLGLEMTAPASLKNPRLIYASFLIINIALLFVLKSFLIR